MLKIIERALRVSNNKEKIIIIKYVNQLKEFNIINDKQYNQLIKEL